MAYGPADPDDFRPVVTKLSELVIPLCPVVTKLDPGVRREDDADEDEERCSAMAVG